MSEAPLTDRELKRMHSLCEQATVEPLALIPQKRERVMLCRSGDPAGEAVLVAKYYGNDRQANASLAAVANRDMRRLLAEVKRLRSLLAEHGIAHE
jgi:hypothetical protein